MSSPVPLARYRAGDRVAALVAGHTDGGPHLRWRFGDVTDVGPVTRIVYVLFEDGMRSTFVPDDRNLVHAGDVPLDELELDPAERARIARHAAATRLEAVAAAVPRTLAARGCADLATALRMEAGPGGLEYVARMLLGLRTLEPELDVVESWTWSPDAESASPAAQAVEAQRTDVGP